MAALKNSSELKSQDLGQVEAEESFDVPLALVQRGEERVVTVHSPARELLAQLDAAVGVDWQTSNEADIAVDKHVLTGLAIMSFIALMGWVGIFNVALAFI